MVMEYVSGGELFDYIVKKGKVCTDYIENITFNRLDIILVE